MDVDAVLKLFDEEQRRNIAYVDMRREETPHVVRYLRAAPGMNTILFHHLDETNADSVIETETEYLRQFNQPFEWMVYSHDHPQDLGERLVQHGYIADEPGAVLVLDLTSAPSSLLQPVQAHVRNLQQPDELEDVIAVLRQVWGGDFSWIRERLGAHLQIPGYLSVYAAYEGQLPVSVGWTYFHPHSQFASIWGGSTLAEHRGKGFYQALLALRTQEALQRGYRFLVIDASPMSRPIVERHGFQLITMSRSYAWKTAAAG